MGEFDRCPCPIKSSNNGRHTLLAGDTSGGVAHVPVDTLKSFWERHELGDRPIRLLKESEGHRG